MIFLTSPGKTYSVNSISGCTVSAGGTTLATISANVQTTFIAPEEEVIVSDDNAIIVEVTGVGAGGSGGTGGSGGSGGPIDLTGVALLEGGNTFTGDQIINGDLTVSGDVTAEGEYNGAEVIETTDTTITPEAGKYYKYIGTEDTITVVAPVWIGYATISYLETAEPVELEGVTWSPAKPSLTGSGPFVYTLVCAESGSVLASVMNYSVATAEAIQQVAPISWSGLGSAHTAGTGDSYAIGAGAKAMGSYAFVGGCSSQASAYSVAIGGRNAIGTKSRTVTIGSFFSDTDGGHSCTTEGTGSITIGAGANTLNNGSTESSNSITIGCKTSNTGADSVVIGAQSVNTYGSNVVIGASSKSTSICTVAVGFNSEGGYLGISVGKDSKANTQGVALGASAEAGSQGCVSIGWASRAKSKNTIAIGNTASITNTTNADNTVTYSDNTIAIGSAATASAPNAVVMGAGASAVRNNSVVLGTSAIGNGAGGVDGGVTIGSGAENAGAGVVVGHAAKDTYGAGVAIGCRAVVSSIWGVAVGPNSKSSGGSISIGQGTQCLNIHSVAIGQEAKSTVSKSVAIGEKATVSDYGAVVFRSTAEDGTITQLYFSGTNTPLANTYEDGEAMMGYVVTDNAGNVMTDAEGNAMVGTQKLSVLFPNNRGENAFTPTPLGLDDEYTPKPMFRPSDLDLPVEDPTEEPEDVTINIPEPIIPEPEPYTPLPVYPIVEPDIPSES